MENAIVFEGDSHRTAVLQRRYNFVLPITEELLDSNRVHLIRKQSNATSTQENEVAFYDQLCEYLIGHLDPEWSEHASKFEKKILKRLHREGHERIAERLNLLIEFLAEDGEHFSNESVEAFAQFVITVRPNYPGPGIFGDDEGHVGIQWNASSDGVSNEDDVRNRGILYLEFVSPDLVKVFGNIEGVDELKGEASLNEVTRKLEHFTERLDW